MPALHEGGCHCGALSYRYQTELPPAQWAVRACQCSFCRRHAALTSSDPSGLLQFLAGDRADLQRYRFSARTADFILCSRCGVYLGAGIIGSSKRFGIINLRALQATSLELPAPVVMNYDGESSAERVARREARWTPLTADSL